MICEYLPVPRLRSLASSIATESILPRSDNSCVPGTLTSLRSSLSESDSSVEEQRERYTNLSVPRIPKAMVFKVFGRG